MNVILIILIGLWAGRIIANILSFTRLWYVKEYRFDRMMIHLTRTRQGKFIYFLPFGKPHVSPKTVVLVSLTTGFVFLVLLFLPVHIVFRFLIADLLTFPCTWVVVGILKIPTFLYHQYCIAKAVRTLRNHAPMIVIGITGSFGKTSTKEYLATIISQKYNTLKTEASRNSPIAIAELINSSLMPDHQVLVVEMAAYKRGEIAKMCAMVKPHIGIITAINAQHQDLFGSLESTMKAKYELIDGLTSPKIGIFNMDNELVRQMSVRAQREGISVWGVGKEKEYVVSSKKKFVIRDEVGSWERITFTLTSSGQKEHVSAPLLGVHQSTNVTLAIAAAVAAGMDLKTSAQRASLITPIKKTLEKVPGVNGSFFINDTFNNNPDAIKVALDILAKSPGKKILVFQPMIELGSFTQSAHEKVGYQAGTICDEIILTNDNYSDYIRSGLASSAPTKNVLILSPPKAASHIRSIVGPGDAVLFKGKEAENVYQILLQ